MSRDFPGTNGNYLAIANPTGPLDLTGNLLSIACWIRPDAITANAQIVGKDIVSSNPRQYALIFSGGSKMRLFFTDSGGGVDFVDSPSNPATGVWQHWVAVKNGTGAGAMALYLNGVLAASATSNRSIGDTAGSFRLGNRDTNDFPYDGQLQGVGVWAAALTLAEIVALSKGVSPQMIRRTSLVGHFPLWGHSAAGEPDLTGAVENLSETGTVGVGANTAPVGPHVLL